MISGVKASALNYQPPVYMPHNEMATMDRCQSPNDLDITREEIINLIESREGRPLTDEEKCETFYQARCLNGELLYYPGSWLKAVE